MSDLYRETQEDGAHLMTNNERAALAMGWTQDQGQWLPPGVMGSSLLFTIPNYTEDIKAAWTLVERVAALPSKGERRRFVTALQDFVWSANSTAAAWEIPFRMSPESIVQAFLAVKSG